MTSYLVTGGNRGIGLSIVKKLNAQDPSGVIYLGSRILQDGQAAIDENGLKNVYAVKLDIGNLEDIAAVVALIKEKHGGLDVLINNAGFTIKGSALTLQIAQTTIGINFDATKNFTDQVLPILKKNGRVIFLSSMMGHISAEHYSQKTRDVILNPNVSWADLESLKAQFYEQVQDKVVDFPASTYRVSKAFVNAANRIYAREFQHDDRNLFFAAVHPGWVKTRMGGEEAPLSDEEGADTPVFLAMNKEVVESGLYWHLRKVEPYSS